ncbi:hypothetical protein Emed_000857 [Eimeria media]
MTSLVDAGRRPARGPPLFVSFLFFSLFLPHASEAIKAASKGFAQGGGPPTTLAFATPGGPPHSWGAPRGPSLSFKPQLSAALTQKKKATREAEGVLSLHATQPQQELVGGGAVVEGDKVNGKSVKEWTVKRSLYQALHMAMAEELERDPTVFIMGEDVGHYGGSYKVTKDLHFRYGNFRHWKPCCCYSPSPAAATAAAAAAAVAAAAVAAAVAVTAAAAIAAVPGLKIVACSTPRNARGLLKAAIRENNPVVFFEHVLTYGITEDIPLLPYTQPLDKAEIALEGSDITILCYSKLRHVALEAAQFLKQLNIHPEVVDLISLKPLDIKTIKQSVKKTGKCLILDESSRTGGIGAEVFAQVVENCAEDLQLPPVRLATKDIPTPYAKALEEATIVTKEDVINAALWMLHIQQQQQQQEQQQQQQEQQQQQQEQQQQQQQEQQLRACRIKASLARQRTFSVFLIEPPRLASNLPFAPSPSCLPSS